MKMPLLRRRRAALLSVVGVPGVLLGVALVLIILLRIFFPGVFFMMVSPVFTLGTSLSHAVGSFMPSDSVQLREERDALLRDNEALRARLALEESGEEPVSHEEGTVAQVVARPPLSPYDSLIVLPEDPSRVRPGAFVSADGVLAGVVADTPGVYARIILFSEPGRSTQGWVGEARIPITLEGKGAGAFSATVPRDAGVLVGDSVYVPGPGAHTIGVVRWLVEDASSPEATVVIRPFVNPFSLTSVVIQDLYVP